MYRKEQRHATGVPTIRKRGAVPKVVLAVLTVNVLFMSCAEAIGIPTIFSMLPPGSSVAGYCHAVNGNFVQSGDLLASQQNLEQAILAVGKVLSTGQMQQMTALQQELNQVLQEQTNLQNQLAAAGNANRVKNQTGTALTATINGKTVYINQPGSICNQPNTMQDIAQGMVANRQMATDFGSVLTGYDTGNLSAMSSLTNLSGAQGNTLTASSIFPTALSSSVYPTPSEAAQAIAHLTEPLPPVQLTKTQKSTPAGTNWRASEHAVNAKMSMAQNALSTIAAWHQPTITAQPFVQQWQSMQSAAQSSTGTGATSPGAAQNPPGVNSSGKISPDGALNLLVEARYANANWYTHLSVESEPGVLKEITEMEAVNLREHWESLRMSEYLAGLSGLQYAHQVVTPTNGTLTSLNANAMAQNNGAMHGQ
jgi:hypothetical protein